MRDAKRARLQEIVLEDDGLYSTVETDPELDPEELLLRQEAHEQMLEDIRSLPKAQQAEVLLYSYGYTHEEIAELLGKPVGTVKSCVFRAKQQIRARREAA